MGKVIMLRGPRHSISKRVSPEPALEDVVELDPVWIPLKDGTRLAATIWLPRDAESRPVPAILEYLPYRRRDGTVARDAALHPAFAARGYAGVRVDIRGTGDSDGLLKDEYLPQEQSDAVEVIEWLAAQSWCSGAVGMIGISWGGFNALQVAALRPKALRAIITLCASDDRYADDCHWMGGALLNNNLAWASTMLQQAAQPPDPDIVGDRWRQMWLDRIENLSLLAEPWLAHQHRDEYWRQGSAKESYDRIEAAVLAVGGWADAYSNAVPRLIENLKASRKGLIGPWGHAYPHLATPGPAIDFIAEATRWWDKWLKGIENGIMDEPPLQVWLDHGARPSPVSLRRQGAWVGLPRWSGKEGDSRRFSFGARFLRQGEQPPAKLVVSSPVETGITLGEWCAYGGDGELAADQRADDGRSVCLDTDALTEPFDLIGGATVELTIASDRPLGLVAVRLTDVSPDGASNLVTYGILNLAHRFGSERPVPLEPGVFETVSIRLNDVAYRFARGQRIRLAISSALWPMVWPAPVLAQLTIDTRGSWIDLPNIPAGERLSPRTFDPPPPSDHAPAVETFLARGRTREISEEPRLGAVTVNVLRADRDYRVVKTGTRVRRKAGEIYRVHADDPLSATTTIWGEWSLQRGAWQIETKSHLRLRASGDHFELSAEIEAFEQGRLVATRNFSSSIPRKLV